MIFLAVGTQFGFDRLVKAVDEAIEQGLIEEQVFAQIGPGAYIPRNMDYVVSMDKEAFDAKFAQCTAIISHAGIGNIALAIDAKKPLLVLPRQRQYGEVVNDHQVHTARKFEKLGHILAAYDTDEMPAKIAQLKTFVPKPRVANRRGVIDRIQCFLSAGQ